MNEATRNAIEQERVYALRRWGAIGHEVGSWILMMERFLERARAAYTGASDDRAALHEIRKVVQLGTACMDQHGAPLRPQSDLENLEPMR